MKLRHGVSIALAATFTLALTLPALAYISGDGKGKPETDCFIGLEGYAPEDLSPFGKKGKPAIQCTDGEECDNDGTVDGACVFSIAVRVNDPNVPGCTPAPLKKVKVKAKTKGTKITSKTDFQVVLDGSSVTSAFVNFPVLVKKFGKPKEKPGKGKVVMLAKKPKDKDKFLFVCNGTGTSTTTTTMPMPECPNDDQQAGQPKQVRMAVTPEGADLDNGTSGRSHNFPVPIGTDIKYCLSDCDNSTDPICDAVGSTGDGSLNGSFFGPPLPLFSAGVPVCVINEYNDPAGNIRGTANIETGEFFAEREAEGATPIILNSRVFQCTTTLVCPRCNGGRCQGGARDGASCTVDGTVVVNNPPAITNDTYNLSNDCPPGGQSCARLGAIEVLLDLTSGTSMLAPDAAGTYPCPNQQQHDECAGSGECTVDCSPGGPNPTQDPKGGVSQFCCSDPQLTPCFPTSAAAGSMSIIRTGEANAPTPLWPDPTYPKTGSGKLVATFCEASTGSIAVDGTAGLPGPGALILPGNIEYTAHEAAN